MFVKPFRVKSNTAIKGSDRRKLRNDVAATFPTLTSEQLAEVVPMKEELNIIKMYTHKGEIVTVYANGKNPILFEMEKMLYPTVYTLWSYPHLLPAFSTWPPVMHKLVGGADLMLPGVIIPKCGLPQINRGTLCAVTLVENRAPVAIGTAIMTTAEMVAAGMKGKGFTVLHTYMDHLWAIGDKSSPPTIPPLEIETPEMVAGEEEEQKNEEGETPESSLSLDPSLQMDTEHLNLEEDIGEKEELSQNDAAEKTEESEPHISQEMEDNRSPQEQMDALLYQCFFHALKCKVKKSELPLLTSTFLRNYMFSCCPKDQQLDIKKSSYKKFSKFLHSVQQQKILQVKELNKGVESIVEVNWRHESIRSFIVPETATSEMSVQDCKGDDQEQLYHPPEIIPLYGISSKMAPLFQESGYKKGHTLSSSEVRSVIISYVKTNELVDEVNKNFVKVNPILCDCLLDKAEQNEISKLKWDDLLSRCLNKLEPFHQVTFSGKEPVVRKGYILPIDVTVAQRSANKKVTIIKNLEWYGLDPQAVASTLQQKVQASATIVAIPGAKDRSQVQIQGNQTNHLAKLLLEDYQIPCSYIQGLKKAPKTGRKK
ncbi:eukaryotic translation initiation factor 2D isoform X1 [Thamnophis elegans]|uniref:eukaryotic translation initiation factor 2D isoform X1 n=1 Tax=Thamnophis elegans TaxID=35005 RepID=UPI001378B7F9|nr:eukaryotic translation initiation factor 2D isoform X1 [Thamnophis elegans]